MIKEICIKNYKSLKDIRVELGKFNVLIGPNASGKSNFIDSLSFLSDIASKGNIEEIAKARGGFEKVIFYGEKEFEIEVEFLSDKQYRYFLQVINQAPYCKEKGFCNGKILFEREGTNLKINHQDKPYLYNALQSIATIKEESVTVDFFKVFHFWKSYQFITSEIRKTLPAKKTFNLEKNGGNLAQVLLSLHTERPKIFSKIEEILKQGISEVEELLTPLTEDGKTFIAIREKGFEHEFDYHQLSDGTLKLLAYITAVCLPESQLICFEEPENFIHPYLLQLLVEILRKSDKQVILSTHSPYLVNFVEPEEVLVVEKKDGQTVIKRIEEPERLREVLKEILLGELWYSGQFGGVP